MAGDRPAEPAADPAAGQAAGATADPATEPGEPTDPGEPEEPPGTPQWVRTAVVAAAVLAVLLLGAATGLLIGLPRSGGDVPPANSVDVGFAQDMALHHQQAVQMANTAREKTTNSEIKQLAFDIESTQLEQVGRMAGWLMLWGQPEQNPGTHLAWMTGAASVHQHGAPAPSTGAVADSDHMPGMASEDELGRLRSLSGQEFDVYFLQLMLRHHEGGTPMAQYAAQHASVPAVRTLADNIVRAQSNEAATIRQLLAERGATPLPPQ
ncbi:DUF305 domain-containing protein [Gandjariella thermophila]|uniref:DUF305 domain-containing protein n=1 Tax=Gandjariella thermophila TaxID=1931992 RepID=A0A4D4JDJ9_9PSEU|nr:DUF305 domain-containing protein [Gandjariella thermophila]GDY32466.1 DUF305 domain-containing protein [Gandjariella thermophila]